MLQERQQNLRALVDWSYELLTPEEQIVLDRLGVFVDGFDLAAAEAVCGGEPLASEDVLDLLGSLIEKSLVMLQERDDGARYLMLETIREYAREKLAQRGDDAAAAAARHCDHYFALAKSARDGLRGPQQADWLWKVEVEHDNIRSAIALSLAGGVDPFIAVKFAVAMQGFWILRGYSTEGRKILQAALALPAIQASPIAQAFALYVGAALAESQSDHAEARKMLETCLELRRALGSEVDIAATLSTLSLARLQGGDADEAAAGENEALQIFRRLGDRVGEAICLLHLGQICLYQGNDAMARSHLEQCLAIGREIRHQEIEGECELVLGEVAFETADQRPGQPPVQALPDGVSRSRRQARRGERAALAGAGRPAGGRSRVGTDAPGRRPARLPRLRDARGAARLPGGPCGARPGGGQGRDRCRAGGRGGPVTPTARPDALAPRRAAPSGAHRQVAPHADRGAVRQRLGRGAALADRRSHPARAVGPERARYRLGRAGEPGNAVKERGAAGDPRPGCG